jgi:hypothetical protein
MAYDHQEALDWFDDAISADQDNRDQFDRNQDMLHGNQWSEKDRATRGEGALVVNKLDTPVILITNQIAQALPGPEVSRRDGPDDEQTAIVYEGILRDIEYCSNAAENGTCDRLITRRVETSDGCDSISITFRMPRFDQELKIGDLADPMMVVADPQAREPDKSDMQPLDLFGNQCGLRSISADLGKILRKRIGALLALLLRSVAGSTCRMKMLWVAEDWLVEYENNATSCV